MVRHGKGGICRILHMPPYVAPSENYVARGRGRHAGGGGSGLLSLDIFLDATQRLNEEGEQRVGWPVASGLDVGGCGAVERAAV